MRLVEFNTDPTAIIKQECKQFLSQSSGLSMWRGITSSEQLLKKKSRLNNRRPMDSPRGGHNEVNKIFKQKFGHEFRNAVFTTGDSTVAGHYGSIYAIYPIGDFKFLWSPSVKDLTMIANSYPVGDTSILQDIWNLFKSEFMVEPPEDLATSMGRTAENSDYQMTNLPAAIKSGHEIMIWCDEYYALMESEQ